MATTEGCVMPREEVPAAMLKVKKSSQENVDNKAAGVKKASVDGKKRRGGRGNSRRKEKASTALTAEGTNANGGTADEDAESRELSKFDCSSAIAQVCEGVWVSAVSGTRMGSSLEAALLEKGVTAVVSTLGDRATQRSETFEHHAVDVSTDACLRPLHAACDFINEAVEQGGVVFIHSRAGFSRGEWAVLLVVGYMIKYLNVKLHDAVEALADTTKHAISPAAKFRRDLVTFEEEALGETSVSDDWLAEDDASAGGAKNHSLSRRKLAEHLNDRRLLKKKSPHK